MTNNDLYKGLFDELHAQGALLSNIAAEIEHHGRNNQQMQDWANRLYTLAHSATRLSIIRPTQLPFDSMRSVEMRSQP